MSYTISGLAKELKRTKAEIIAALTEGKFVPGKIGHKEKIYLIQYFSPEVKQGTVRIHTVLRTKAGEHRMNSNGDQ